MNKIDEIFERYKTVHPNATKTEILDYMKKRGFSASEIQKLEDSINVEPEVSEIRNDTPKTKEDC